MSDETIESERAIQRGPEQEELNNGAVRIVIDCSDCVAETGIRTEMVSVKADRSVITEELAEHIEWEYLIDVEEHGIEVDDGSN